MDSDTTPTSLNKLVESVLGKWQRDPNAILQMLIEVQHQLNHIPKQVEMSLAAALDLPHSQVDQLIDFYSFLSRNDRGRYDIRFADNIVEQMKDSRALASRLAAKLGIVIGQTDSQKSVTLDYTSCSGMSDQAPALLVNNRAIPRLDRSRIDTIAELILNESPVENWPADLFRINPGLVQSGPLLQCDYAPGTAIRKAIQLGADNIIEQLTQSGLRGRGGAGFRTASKWQFCRQASSGNAVVVCNADEGEPGTFKDRLLLQQHADKVIEGMTACAAIVGASQGFIYLRGEYRFLLQPLLDTLQRRRDSRLLGSDICNHPGFNFDIQLHLGAGAYICGEESALIESLEGHRGIPRARPPFPVEKGYRQRPTVVNNVETLVAAAAILANGPDWFRQWGTEQSSGTKLLSISGDCDQPGIYEIAFGASMAEILEACGADNTQAVQISGAAGMMLPATEFERRIGFEDLPTGGSLMVFSRRRSILDITKNFADFFCHESCGFCTPCRVGTTLINRRLDKVRVGHATNEDLQAMKTIGHLMQEASHCGLGQTAANPILDALQHFPDAFLAQLRSTRFEPAFDLDEALGDAREITRRSDPDAYLKGGGV